MNLFDMLKADKGIPVSDPMAMLWGYQYRKKHSLSEISGVPPLHFTSRGEHLLDYRIYGNTVQDGTPTPETPVEVLGCGVKTTNLINIEQHNTENVSKSSDGSYFVYSYDKWCWCIPTEIGKTYCVSVSLMNEYKNSTKLEIALCKGYRTPYTPNGSAIIRASLKDVEAYKIHTRTFKFTATDEWLSINGMSTHVYTIMINEDSADLPYEPYGYKIPVTVSDGRNAVTTPVYIGSEPLHKIGDYADYVDFKRGVVVRNIKKIVLTGDENWLDNFHNANQNVYKIMNFANFRTLHISSANVGILRCTHILYAYPYPSNLFDRIVLVDDNVHPHTLFFSTKKSMGFNTVTSFKNFLAEQYELGQPVTIWYIAAEPEEEPLENLLPIQTIKGSDVLTVGTTVQPSEMYIKYKKG